MAEIEKGLPNTRTKLEIPSDEELQEVAVQEEEQDPKGPVEVVPEEDGGATIDFEPGAINIPGTESHFDNLADILPDDVLEPTGNEMVQNYMDYKGSRKEWEQSYKTGLDLLGFGLGFIVILRRVFAKINLTIGWFGLSIMAIFYGTISGVILGPGSVLLTALAANGLMGPQIVGTDSFITLINCAVRLISFRQLGLLSNEAIFFGSLK